MPKLGLGLSLPQTRVSGGSLIPASGLSLWLKADAGVTLSGSDVTAWADQSGNGRTVTLANSPSFTASSINSRPTVDFNGSTQFADALTPAFVGNNNFSVIWVFKYVGDSATGAGDPYSPSVTFLSDTGTDQGSFHYIKNENKFPASYPLFLTQGWTPYDYSDGFTYSDGSNYILEFISNQSSGVYSVFRNTALEGSEAIGTAADSDVIGIRIAGQQDPERYGNIRMAEIVVYDRVLTTPERQQVEAYLMNKYNIPPPVFSRAFDSLGDQVGASNLGDIPTSWVANQTTVTSVIFANDNSVTSIGSDAFGYCNLSGITIPNSVTDIGSFVFQYTALTNITIPNSVTSIGTAAFQNCTSLATVTIGTGVTSVSERMFQGCTSLTSITIPNSVTSIGSYAFDGCTSLATATIGTGVTSLPTQAFVSTGLTAITIPNTITSLGQESFKNCTSLASITFTAPSTLTSLGNYTFQGCTSLTSITIPPSVTSIGSYSFAFSGFTTINIPNTVTSIGEYAFKTSTSLATVTIGTGVTSVADYAFDGCTSLATVLCYVAQSALTSLGAYYTFRGTASPLTIRARSTDASWTAGTGLGFLGNANVTVIKNL